MKELWGKYASRFDGLGFRERALVVAAALMGILLLGHVLFVEPQLARQAFLSKQLAKQQNDLKQIQEQMRLAESRLRDPDADNRDALERLRANLSELEGRLRDFEKILVPPDKVAVLLEELLSRNRGVKLVSLRTLPVGSLIERKEAVKAAEDAGEDTGRQGALYKHGVEITLEGSYPELLEYVSQIERLSGQLLWSRMTLAVDEHPRARLTLTVYTVSLDKTWLTV